MDLVDFRADLCFFFLVPNLEVGRLNERHEGETRLNEQLVFACSDRAGCPPWGLNAWGRLHICCGVVLRLEYWPFLGPFLPLVAAWLSRLEKRPQGPNLWFFWPRTKRKQVPMVCTAYPKYIELKKRTGSPAQPFFISTCIPRSFLAPSPALCPAAAKNGAHWFNGVESHHQTRRELNPSMLPTYYWCRLSRKGIPGALYPVFTPCLFRQIPGYPY